MVTKKILLSALLAGGLFGAFQAQAMEAARELTNGEGSDELIRLEEQLPKYIAEYKKAEKEYQKGYAKAQENQEKNKKARLPWVTIFFHDVTPATLKRGECERRVSETEARIKALKKALR